jgi:hypothetical protein
MRILSLILVLAVACSAMGANKMPAPATAASGDEHACCKAKDSSSPSSHENEKKHECGKCLMVCCRIVTAPADPVAAPLEVSPVAVRIVLLPVLADDLSEPQSIFHPPRA